LPVNPDVVPPPTAHGAELDVRRGRWPVTVRLAMGGVAGARGLAAVLEEAAQESDHADRADDDEDEAKSGQRHRGGGGGCCCGGGGGAIYVQTREFDGRAGSFGATSVGVGFKKPTQERRRKEVGVDGEEHEASDLGEDRKRPLRDEKYGDVGTGGGDQDVPDLGEDQRKPLVTVLQKVMKRRTRAGVWREEEEREAPDLGEDRWKPLGMGLTKAQKN
ncbi:hypothetical protein O988_07538, partial [Pseudogymnoascus sp. VKM F-3808]